jgi:hypothetical protein
MASVNSLIVLVMDDEVHDGVVKSKLYDNVC